MVLNLYLQLFGLSYEPYIYIFFFITKTFTIWYSDLVLAKFFNPKVCSIIEVNMNVDYLNWPKSKLWPSISIPKDLDIRCCNCILFNYTTSVFLYVCRAQLSRDKPCSLIWVIVIQVQPSNLDPCFWWGKLNIIKQRRQAVRSGHLAPISNSNLALEHIWLEVFIIGSIGFS